MRLALLTNIVSPHQLPFACEMADRLGHDNFRYIATEGEHCERRTLGWHIGELPPWVIYPKRSSAEAAEAQRWRSEATVLLSGLREFDLFRQRARRGLINFYMFERWFKPPIGLLRILHPGYLRMARKLWTLQRQGSVICLPIGIHAANDMTRICDIFQGNIKSLFLQPRSRPITRQPLASFESVLTSKAADNLMQMRLWGYCVDPGDGLNGSDIGATAKDDREPSNETEAKDSEKKRVPLLRVLWVGRMLNWKRVDTLIKAVVRLLDQGAAIQLKVVGYGPEEKELQRLAGKYLITGDSDLAAGNQAGSKCEDSGIVFKEPVPIQQVRGLMRTADVFVLSSDSGEGWGATVNEAMAEGCCVIGTRQAGSSATMIEHGVNGWLYNAGNVTELTGLLGRCDKVVTRRCGKNARQTIDALWSPASAADRLIEFINETIAPSKE